MLVIFRGYIHVKHVKKVIGIAIHVGSTKWCSIHSHERHVNQTMMGRFTSLDFSCLKLFI